MSAGRDAGNAGRGREAPATPHRHRRLIVAIVVGSIALLVLDETAGSQASPGRSEALREARALGERTDALLRAGRVREAIPLARKAVEILRRVLGERHPGYAGSVCQLGLLYKLAGEYEKAEPLYREAIRIWRVSPGADPGQLALGLNNLGVLYSETGEYGKAESLLREVLGIHEESRGESHPQVGVVLLNLAHVQHGLGEYETAASLCRRAVRILEKAFGEDHPDHASGLDLLAQIYFSMGAYARAEPLYRRSLRIREKLLREGHPAIARTLHRLAVFHSSLGEYAKAEALCRKAIRIYEESLGESNPELAKQLSTLALIRVHMTEFAEAEALILRALRITRESRGETHPECATMLNNLGFLYSETGEFAKAAQVTRQALEIRKRSVGESHPMYAQNLGNLAAYHAMMGDLGKAEALCRRSLGILRGAVAEDSPDLARCLHDLAKILMVRGHPAEAAPLCREALAIRRGILDETFSVLSERQRFRMSRSFRESLDLHLQLSARKKTALAEAYEPLLAWKGAVFARQALERVRARDPGSAGLLDELMSVSRRFATLSLAVPGKTRRDAWRRQLGELSERREDLERELSRKSAAYREVRASDRLTTAELQNFLSVETTLVDLIEYEHRVITRKRGRGTVRRELRFAAFLVPGAGRIRRVDLGPAAPIVAAIERWRAGIAGRRSGEAGRELRRLVWEPLAEKLVGCRTILLSPDGALNRVPLAALPGREPGTYLLEEVAVAVVPVPRRLPGLLARSDVRPGAESLLVLGDVDYGGRPGRSDGAGAPSRSAAGTIGGRLSRFGTLPATRAEIGAIRRSFEARHRKGEVKVLGRAEATEAAFRAEAGKHGWLHLATHGFFAPPGLRSALARKGGTGEATGASPITGYHPGVLSGLALSGANTPPEPDGDDGILTALEVASLDLSNVEMAVLSACETGLGEVAGGEGVLGLQRAFQVAGARTTLTSLWKVPDEATRLLMERFYANVWDRNLGKLEALREAQLWLMREGRSRLTVVGGDRGVRVPGQPAGSDEGSKSLPPFHWAAFVLSGHWR